MSPPVVSQYSPQPPCSLQRVEIEDPTEARTAVNGSFVIVVLRSRQRRDQLPTQALMKSFGIVVLFELAKEVAKMPLAADQEVVQALGPDSLHESLGVRIGLGCQLRRVGTNRRELTG